MRLIISLYAFQDLVVTFCVLHFDSILTTKAVFVSAMPSCFPSLIFSLPSSHPGLNKKERRKELLRRLQCAFILAEHLGGGRRGTTMVKELDETQIITTKDVYLPEVACHMWAIFGAEAQILGYTLPNGITEEECGKFEAFDYSLSANP